MQFSSIDTFDNSDTLGNFHFWLFWKCWNFLTMPWDLKVLQDLKKFLNLKIFWISKNPGSQKPRCLKVFKITPYIVGTMVDFWRQIQYIATWEIGFHSCVNGNSIFGQTLLAIVKKRWHKENMLTNLWLDTWSVKFAISWEFSTKSLPRNQFLLIGIWFWNVTWYNLT